VAIRLSSSSTPEPNQLSAYRRSRETRDNVRRSEAAAGLLDEESMIVRSMWRRLSAAVTSGAIICAAARIGGTHAQPIVTVVMSELDNPRGLAFGPEGALYVAEAGRGGDGPCFFNSAGEFRCYGPTRAITRLWHGVVTGLPSHAPPGGAFAGGANDISFQGVGGMFVAMGLGNDPQLIRPSLGTAGNVLGTLLQVNAAGGWRVLADIAAYEAAVDPNGGLIDSNPFGVLAEAGARLVVDAGANALFRVAADGTITTMATFPSRPIEVLIRFLPRLRWALTAHTTSASLRGCRSRQERLVSTAWSKAWSQRSTSKASK
jgi:hypothetical protein